MMTPDTPSIRDLSRHPFARLAVTLAVIGSLFFGAVGPVAAQTQPDEPATVLDVHEDGSAELMIVLTYDLTTETEQQAFQLMQENEDTVSDIHTRFESRITEVVSSAADRTGREMNVTNTSVSLSTTDGNETGIVRLSAMIENLAAVEEGTLVVTEPFASGFYADRPVHVRIPDGYSVASASPEPDSTDGTTVTWASDTEFDGFELVLEPTDGPKATDAGEGTTATSTPGFGLGVAAIGLLAAALLARRFTDQ